MPPHSAEERHLMPDKPEAPGIGGQLFPRGQLLALLVHMHFQSLCKIDLATQVAPDLKQLRYHCY